MNPTKNRLYGLDALRATAIILVFMCHYGDFVSSKLTFGFLTSIGWVGVDLFFILSGYLIGNQIFSSLAKRQEFSLRVFYYRRLLRTLPNYFVVVALYFLIPAFKEAPLTTPLWKFLTFTQNFGLHTGVAFSHAWSLCIEEQFYLILPAVALLIAFKGSRRSAWWLVLAVLLGGIILRGYFWLNFYLHNPNGNFQGDYFHARIYYSSFCRLDELVLGVAIALIKNFHTETWSKMITRGNSFLAMGMVGTTITFYLFLHYHFSFFMMVFGFPLLAFSFASLTMAGLSPNSWLYKIRIPGAASIAAWSYAIYLTHKALIVMTANILAKFGINGSNFITVIAAIFVALLGGWLLYTCVETPFLKLRDKLYSKENARASSSPFIHLELNQKIQD